MISIEKHARALREFSRGFEGKLPAKDIQWALSVIIAAAPVIDSAINVGVSFIHQRAANGESVLCPSCGIIATVTKIQDTDVAILKHNIDCMFNNLQKLREEINNE